MAKLKSREEFIKLRKKLIKLLEDEKRIISVCGSTGCSAFGSADVIAAFKEQIEKNRLQDKVAVRKTGCHGFCEKGPIVTILPEDYFYNRVEVEDVPEIIERTIEKSEIVERLLYIDPQTGKKCVHTHDVRKEIDIYLLVVHSRSGYAHTFEDVESDLADDQFLLFDDEEINGIDREDRDVGVTVYGDPVVIQTLSQLKAHHVLSRSKMITHICRDRK